MSATRALRRWIGGVLLLALASGCGSTQILTDDPQARIYADGRMIGKGKGELTKRGFPGGTTVVVASEDGRRETTQVKREFTVATLVLGLFTYGICLVTCWEYPGMVFVPIAPRVPYANSYGPPGQPPGAPGAPATAPVDPWLQPPPGYQTAP
jgi:hypothetical protein